MLKLFKRTSVQEEQLPGTNTIKLDKKGLSQALEKPLDFTKIYEISGDLTGEDFQELSKVLQSKELPQLKISFKGATLDRTGTAALLKLHQEKKIELNLSGVTLVGDFSGMNFLKLDLSNATLRGTILKGTVFNGSNLNGTDFSDATFSRETKMFNIRCRGANFSKMRGSVDKGNWSFMYKEKLTESYLQQMFNPKDPLDSGSTLQTIASIAYHELRETLISNLKNCLAKSAPIKGISFAGATLNPIEIEILLHLRDEGLIHLNLSGATLVGDFSGMNFSKLNLTNTNLEGTVLKDTNFDGAILTNANFSEATLSSRTSFRDIRCRGANFNAIKGDPDPRKWSLRFRVDCTPQDLDTLLDPQEKSKGASILKTMASFPGKGLKIQFAIELITYIKKNKLSKSELAPFSACLLEAFLPLKDAPEIQEFITFTLLPSRMEASNKKLKPLSASECHLFCDHLTQQFTNLLKYSNSDSEEDVDRRHAFVSDNSVAMNTIFASVPGHKDEALSAKTNELLTTWETFTFRYLPKKDVANEDYYHFFKETPSSVVHIMIEKDRFSQLMLSPETCSLDGLVLPFSSPTWRPDGWKLTSEPLSILPEFPCLVDQYEPLIKEMALYPFFKTIFKDPETHSLALLFTVSTTQSSCTDNDFPELRKWITELCNPQVNNIFSVLEPTEDELFPSNPALTLANATERLRFSDSFFSELQTHFQGLAKTPAEQAMLFLSLAFNFSYLSSSYMFGSERKSPLPLRIFALACLNHAFSLMENLNPSERPPFRHALAQKKAWQDKLTGVGDAFSCTAILARKNYTELIALSGQNHEFKQLFETLVPTAWVLTPEGYLAI